MDDDAVDGIIPGDDCTCCCTTTEEEARLLALTTPTELSS
jgi:hypothetical protein